jgi:poly(hydroxyalkanoate) depolymerase family esterase
MKFDLSRVMREATTLTRDQRLSEATQRIGEALATSGLRRPPAAKLPGASLGAIVKALQQGKTVGVRGSVLRGLKPRGMVEVAAGAQFLEDTFSCDAGTRNYKVYLPANRSTRGLPLVVMLHGCTQDPDDFALGTGMNTLAEEIGFVVAYPEQPRTANPSSCWNWFEPKDQRRGAGEPSIIAGVTREIVKRYDLDRSCVFIAGLSAGGAMAATLGATYPDVYAAIGVHSGLAHGAARDVVSAFAAMRGETGAGPRHGGEVADNGAVRTIIFHGAADRTVHPANADAIAGTRSSDGSDSVHTERGVRGGRRYSRTIVTNKAGRPLAEQWLIDGAGHAWSGGNPNGSFSDPAGPDASREMIRFFLEREYRGADRPI